MTGKQEIDKRIHDILRERQLIPVGMQLGGVELMQFRAVLEGMADKQESPDMTEQPDMRKAWDNFESKVRSNYNNWESCPSWKVDKARNAIQALYAPVIQTLKAEKKQKQMCIDDLKRQLGEIPNMVEQAVKVEHDRMIKHCVDEGNDAYKRGVDKERERIYKLWREDTNDGEVHTSLSFCHALKETHHENTG